MSMKKASALACTLGLALAVLLALGGCGEAPSSSEQDGMAKAAETIEITDVAGQTLTFDHPVDKAIIQWSGSGGGFIVMSALFGSDVPQHIAAMDSGLENYRADMWANFCKSVPDLENVPKIGTIGKDFDVEAAIASDADVAILPYGLQKSASEAVQAKLEAAGIPVVYIDFHDETVENHVKSVQIMGKLFGLEERAQEICDFYLEHRQNVDRRIASVLETESRPSMYIEVGMGGPEKFGNSYTNSYMWGGIAFDSGADSIGDGVIENAAELDPEYVLESNPQKIVLTGSYWPDQAASVRMGFDADETQLKPLVDAYFNERSGWSDLSAWKNKQIYVVHHGIGRNIYDCACYEFFAQVCFPKEFSDLDPAATLKEFYQRFLPYEFSGLWFYVYQ